MNITKTWFIWLFIGILSLGNYDVSIASVHHAEHISSTTPTSKTSKSKAKRKKQKKQKRKPHKRNKTQGKSIGLVLGITALVAGTALWLIGFFGANPLLMFIGLGIIGVIALFPLGLDVDIAFIVTLLVLLTIGLFILGFYFSLVLAWIMLVLLLLEIIGFTIAAIFLASYFLMIPDKVTPTEGD